MHRLCTIQHSTLEVPSFCFNNSALVKTLLKIGRGDGRGLGCTLPYGKRGAAAPQPIEFKSTLVLDIALDKTLPRSQFFPCPVNSAPPSRMSLHQYKSCDRWITEVMEASQFEARETGSIIRRSRPSAWAFILRLIIKATVRTASAAVIHDTARIWGPRVSSGGRTWNDSAIVFGLMLG